jgi:hypothetical protein
MTALQSTRMYSNRVGHELCRRRKFCRSGYNYGGVQLHCSLPECSLTELDMNLSRRSAVLLRVDRVVEVRVEVGLLRLVRGEVNFGQSASTRSEHKPLALSEVRSKHCQREYDCRNRGLILHCTNYVARVRFTRECGKIVVTPCALLQIQFHISCSLPDVEANTMMCRTTEDVAENSQ